MFQRNSRFIFIALCIGLCLTSYAAFANCSRIINVPLSAENTSNKSTNTEVKHGDFNKVIMPLMDSFGKKYGCQFAYTNMPKTRQELLFRNGESDILFLAAKSSKRDEVGLLIPFFQIKPAIISNKKFTSESMSLKRIREDKKIKLILVSGYDYGDRYREFIRAIEKDNRVSYEADAFSLVRMMSYKSNVVSIISPSIIEDVLKNEQIFNSLIGNIQYDEIVEFPWTDVGIYISKISLLENDFKHLKRHLPMITSREQIWKWIQSRYSKEVLTVAFRQMP